MHVACDNCATLVQVRTLAAHLGMKQGSQMQEHVGKKRKKELREAVNLRDERNSHIKKCAIVYGAAIAICIVYFACCSLEVFISFSNLMFTFIPLAVVVASLFIAGADITRAQVANDKYKKYCAEHSVTKEDIKHFIEATA